MFTPSLILLTVGFLVLICILASRASDRLGVPALIVFLASVLRPVKTDPGAFNLTMHDRSTCSGNGPGAYPVFRRFEHQLASCAPGRRAGFILATFGVVVTAGWSAYFLAVVGLDAFNSALLGAIISSTDAAAVFSILAAGAWD